ncbi:hypothetical protein HELRODRAFT_173841 [Helobdella robusta]|uniref:Uncharacterized protein n=1 Tax=Helobdella robusta TaxID=6412 RepID=T1F7A8_HELRO|nr:hypothetical protein HELRODRAFT_173841 [Helobdella robusta]ESO02999.1 hypothetical protein HELRODRAFT_173841 [Helobdella robusta]
MPNNNHGTTEQECNYLVCYYFQRLGMQNTEFMLEPKKLRRQRIFWRGKFLESRVKKASGLRCIGFDGRIDEIRLLAIAVFLCTNVNTGKHNGVIRLLGTALNRPLQWLICMSHLNELPFCAIFTKLDGTISGLTAFRRNIGSRLNFDLKGLIIINFKAVPEGKDNAVEQDLNFLASAFPESIYQARWLTFANRVLSLYNGTENLSEEMLKIVSFIVQVYAPSWFNIVEMVPEICFTWFDAYPTVYW